MGSNSGEKLTLKTDAGDKFVVEKQVAMQSLTIKNVVDSDSPGDVIPVANVSRQTLALVIEYCEKHANQEAERKEDLDRFDAEFVEKKDFATLFDLILAANYLEIKGLLAIISQKIADEIKNKSHQEVREIFNIENDFSPEEEAKIRAEYDWAFEGFP